MKKQIIIDSENEKLTKQQLIDQINKFKEVYFSEKYTKIVEALDRIVNDIKESGEQNVAASDEHFATFKMFLLMVRNFDSEKDVLAIMKPFFLDLIRMVATKKEKNRENLRMECRNFIDVYKITLENRFEYLGEDSLALAFLYDFVVNLRAHFEYLDSRIIDENSKEESLAVYVDKISRFTKKEGDVGESCGSFMLNIIEFFYVIVLFDKKDGEYVPALEKDKPLIKENILQLLMMMDEFFKNSCDNLLDIYESNIAEMREFYKYFMVVILEWREFLQAERGLEIHFAFDELPVFPELKLYSQQPVYYENLNQNILISTNNKKVDSGDINSISEALLKLIQDLMKALKVPHDFSSKITLDTERLHSFKADKQLKEELCFLQENLDDLRNEKNFCDNSADLLKYACLKPILIYLDLCFNESNETGFSEKIEVAIVEDVFNKINGDKKVEGIYEGRDGDDVKYLNYPLSFMRVLCQYLKVVMGYECNETDILDENFNAQQTLSFLARRTDGSFSNTMQDIYNLFYPFFQNNIYKFQGRLKNYFVEKNITIWIDDRFKKLMEIQGSQEECEGNEDTDPEDTDKFINECATINVLFDKNDSKELSEIKRFFKRVQIVMVDFRKSSRENYYVRKYASLFEKDLVVLMCLLKNDALYKSVVFVSDAHVVAAKHYVYRVILKIIKRINFLENEKKQKNEENSKLNQKTEPSRNRKNVSSVYDDHSAFVLKLDKESLFSNLLAVAAKDSKDEKLKEIIEQMVSAFVELIVNKYVWRHYRQEVINVFKLDINAKVENKSDSKVARDLLKENYPAHYNLLKDKLLEVDEQEKPNQNKSIDNSSVLNTTKSSKNNNSKDNRGTKKSENKSRVSECVSEKNSQKTPIKMPVKKETTKIGSDNFRPIKKVNKTKTNGSRSNAVGKKETAKTIGKNIAIDKKDGLTIGEGNGSGQQENHKLTVEITKQPIVVLEKDIIDSPEKDDLIENIDQQPIVKTNETSSKERELENQLELIKLQLSEAQKENQRLSEQEKLISEKNQKLKESENQTSKENRELKNQNKQMAEENQNLRKQAELINEKINQHETDLQKERKKQEEVEQELKIVTEKWQGSQNKVVELEKIQKQNQGAIVYLSNKIDIMQKNANFEYNNENHSPHDNGYPNYNFVQPGFNQPPVKNSQKNNPYKKYNRTVYGKNHNRVWNQPRNNNIQPTPNLGQQGDYAPAPENK